MFDYAAFGLLLGVWLGIVGVFAWYHFQVVRLWRKLGTYGLPDRRSDRRAIWFMYVTMILGVAAICFFFFFVPSRLPGPFTHQASFVGLVAINIACIWLVHIVWIWHRNAKHRLAELESMAS